MFPRTGNGDRLNYVLADITYSEVMNQEKTNSTQRLFRLEGCGSNCHLFKQSTYVYYKVG